MKQLEGCWEWQAGRNRDGYGMFMLMQPKRCGRSHRIAHELVLGETPAGMVVRHRCDNPACCNPEHLELGTQAQNIQDMVERGRNRGPSSTRSRSTKLTPVQVEEVRRSTGTLKEVAAKYGVHFSTIARIRRGETWRAAA